MGCLFAGAEGQGLHVGEEDGVARFCEGEGEVGEQEEEGCEEGGVEMHCWCFALMDEEFVFWLMLFRSS